MKKTTKTNVMRLLEQGKIEYDMVEYEVDESDLSGVHAAASLGQPEEKVFKTLVLKGDKTGHLVCCIPVAMEVDLKKVAKLSGNKKVEMIPMKELLPTTGYIRGGCSPVGMKKKFPTYLHQSALDKDRIAISGGARGVQVILNPCELQKYTQAESGDIVKS